uniref:Rho-GAP domain-containing protein n=1 Tax=Globodera rostochiensis TaxID=31243 RepID=A0A914I524_GLORO
MLLGSDLAAALGTSASRATTPIGAQTPLIGDRASPASVRRRLLHPSMSRQRSPLFFAPNILRPNECQHFHYDFVELGPVRVHLVGMEEEEEESERKRNNNGRTEVKFTLSIESNGKIWQIVRTSAEMVEFDRQLHRCVFERRHSRLEELDTDNSRLKLTICCYTGRLSLLTGSLMRCYPVLTFFELDNRGNHFLPVEYSLPNIPAVACAVAICPFDASQSDQLRLRVGDIVSVVEIDTKCDEKWMRGKLTVPSNDNQQQGTPCDNRRFGCFPARCVRLFSDRLSLGEQLWMASNSGTSTVARRSLPSFLPRQRRNSDGRPSMFSAALIRSFIVRISKHASPHTTSFQSLSTVEKSSVFGVDLVELMAKHHGDKHQTEVADVVEQCIRVVESRGMEAGIYRQCGVQSNVRRLRRMFSSGRVPEWECPSVSDLLSSDIHSVGSLLKHFFRQLPNPLIPFQCQPKLIDAFGGYGSSVINGKELISKVSQIINKFPSAHYHNAKRLFLHLQAVSRHPRTQTNARNLAIIWTPNLIRNGGQQYPNYQLASLNLHTDICTFLIAFADKIFSDSSGNGIVVSRSSSMGSVEVDSWRRQHEHGKCIGVANSPKMAVNGMAMTSLVDVSETVRGTGQQQQKQHIGPVHSVLERSKRPIEKRKKQNDVAGNSTTIPRIGESVVVDHSTQLALGQRLLSPLGKSLDEMGHSMFRRVRSMRHSVRRKFFKESPEMSKSCHQLNESPLSTTVAFVGGEQSAAAPPVVKEDDSSSNDLSRPPSSCPFLAIPFADDACSASRSATLSPSCNSSDALSAITTRGGVKRELAASTESTKTVEKRVNFEDGTGQECDGGEQQNVEQFGENRPDSVESIPLDISRYDNVHSIVVTCAPR